MTKLFREAIERVETLPEATQESIAEELINHVKKVVRLRSELQKGIDSLDCGEGEEFDIEDVIKRARITYDRR